MTDTLTGHEATGIPNASRFTVLQRPPTTQLDTRHFETDFPENMARQDAKRLTLSLQI